MLRIHYGEGRPQRLRGPAAGVHAVASRGRAGQAPGLTRARLKPLLDEAPIGIYVVDADFRFCQVNSRARAVLGEERALIGADLAQVVHQLWSQDYADEFLARVRHTLETGEPDSCPEHVEKRRDRGVTECYEWQINRIPLSNGRPGVVCYFQDISARVAARGALIKSEAGYRALFDGTSDAVLLADLHGVIHEANDAACRMSGYTRQELAGMLLSDLDASATRQEMDEYIQMLARSENPDRFESQHRRKDGSLVEVEITALYLYQEGGRIAVLARDITERKQAEERLLAAERARAEQAERMADEIDHRVKNNLAMISGLLHVQLLREAAPEAGAALREAIGRIHTFAAIHEQVYATRGEEVDLLLTLERLGASMAELFAEGACQVSVHGEPCPCHARVATNLATVANELITNALKYGGPAPDGRRAISITLRRLDEGLALSVWNSGPAAEGLDPARAQTMGMRLVYDMVVRQYRGRFSVSPAQGGMLAEAFFPRDRMAADLLPR